MKIFYKNSGLLEFKAPANAADKGRSNGVEMLVVPINLVRSHELNAGNLKKWGKMPSAYRNIIAWYLRAAGVPIKDAAHFLSISDSRVSALVTKVRRLVYVKPSLRPSKSINKKNFSPEVFKAHCAKQWHKEMIDAEYTLSFLSLFGIQEDHFVISEALRLGRQAHLESTETLGGFKCDCLECGVVDDMIKRYLCQS